MSSPTVVPRHGADDGQCAEAQRRGLDVECRGERSEKANVVVFDEYVFSSRPSFLSDLSFFLFLQPSSPSLLHPLATPSPRRSPSRRKKPILPLASLRDSRTTFPRPHPPLISRTSQPRSPSSARDSPSRPSSAAYVSTFFSPLPLPPPPLSPPSPLRHSPSQTSSPASHQSNSIPIPRFSPTARKILISLLWSCGLGWSRSG